MGARWYDPTLGRFIEQDLIGEAGGMNLYAYTGSSPVMWTDPSGLCPLGQPYSPKRTVWDEARTTGRSVTAVARNRVKLQRAMQKYSPTMGQLLSLGSELGVDWYDRSDESSASRQSEGASRAADSGPAFMDSCVGQPKYDAHVDAKSWFYYPNAAKRVTEFVRSDSVQGALYLSLWFLLGSPEAAKAALNSVNSIPITFVDERGLEAPYARWNATKGAIEINAHQALTPDGEVIADVEKLAHAWAHEAGHALADRHSPVRHASPHS